MRLTTPLSVLFSSDKKLSSSIKNIFGFYPGNVFLYQLAFRHKSASREFVNGIKLSNERLEYLGDAVLSSIVADFLFKKFPYKEEGFLTEMRARIVSRSQLNKLSKKLGLSNLIESEEFCNNHSKSLHGDAFEAFVGALYLDRGYKYTRKILLNRVIEVHFDIDKLQKQDTNFKSQLIEWSQKEKVPIEFKVVDEVGNGYGKQYIVELQINQESYSNGRDFSIKGAEQQAAGKALERLENESKI
ncbi:MAG TPA: ribonuclease III [Bacteroidales bacterium]|nr:ribonuclease III [Bacteroidales bacterium]